MIYIYFSDFCKLTILQLSIHLNKRIILIIQRWNRQLISQWRPLHFPTRSLSLQWNFFAYAYFFVIVLIPFQIVDLNLRWFQSRSQYLILIKLLSCPINRSNPTVTWDMLDLRQFIFSIYWSCYLPYPYWLVSTASCKIQFFISNPTHLIYARHMLTFRFMFPILLIFYLSILLSVIDMYTPICYSSCQYQFSIRPLDGLNWFLVFWQLKQQRIFAKFLFLEETNSFIERAGG